MSRWEEAALLAEEGLLDAERRGRAVAELRDRFARLAAAMTESPDVVLGAILVVAFCLRWAWLTVPATSTIFDETYYVDAARAILGWQIPAGAPYVTAPPGLDPNAEHPPLGKVLIAGSMLIFGDSPIGWRLPSIAAGMIALLALFGIVRASGESRWLGILAVGLFSLDNLSFVHGRIATLDMLVLAPILVGAWLALRRRWELAGIACALGMLIKVSAAFGVLAIVFVWAVEAARAWRAGRRLDALDRWAMVRFLAPLVFVSLGGLWVMDLAISPYKDPIAHLIHIVTFGAKLQAPGGMTGIASEPWRWLENQLQINYYRTAADILANGKVVGSHASIDFRGALNPFLIGAAPIAFAAAAWLALQAENRLALWAVAWAAANYLPYWWLVIVGNRITYLYYFLPVVPALAVAVALLLRRTRLPRGATAVYVVTVVAGFLAYFPFREIPA